uniref:ATP-dependent DNA helicase n=1 Tax=Macrostomum lignano TaxID=282301 RepID=A0A1I8H7N0_9PLAT
MNRACQECGALLWRAETRNFCCAKGKVKLPSRTVPQVLADLYMGRHRLSVEFLANIRSYNSALHLTSLGAKLRLVPGWCPSFIISGQMHHRTAPLFAEASAEAQGWQVYFNDRELESRQSLSQKVKPELLELLQTLLHECNGYVRSLKAAAERISQDPELGDARIVIHPDRRPSGEHIRRYNLPTANEVGILIVEDNEDAPASRDVVIQLRGGGSQRISETHRSYDPLEYVLLFPNGEDGWHPELRMSNDKKLTPMKYYASEIMVRAGQFSVLHYGRRLFQQYLVDMCAKIEAERLLYLRTHQQDLRSETYSGLRDALWVVPYSPDLLLQFACHMNVEVCATVKSVKYVIKYLLKGGDMATFKVDANKNSTDPREQAVGSQQPAETVAANDGERPRDEIKEYLSARYIGPMEAVHDRFPAVIRLCVHKSEEQLVYFNEQTASARARTPRDSTLTAFFKLCRTDEFARSLLYTEVPSYFVWHASERVWRRAKRGAKVDGHPGVVRNTNVARMYTVRGPTSFEALLTVDGVVHPSAKAACMALGLLQRDDHWRRCLAEAVQSRMPRALRHLLAVILIWGDPDDGNDLWCSFAEDMCEDLRFHHRDLSTEEITDLALRELQSMLTSMGGNNLPDYGLPAASAMPQVGPMQFDAVEQAQITEARLPMLTDEQKAVYESVTQDLVSGNGGLHFLDAPAGTGKTFLLEVLLAFVRSRGEVALAVAASGIAATLLPGGQTAHSTSDLEQWSRMWRRKCPSQSRS